MRCGRLMGLGLTVLTLALPAEAADCGMVGKLAAQFVPGSNAMNVEIGLLNHSHRNLCFRLYDSGPVMRTKTGGSLPMHATGDAVDLGSIQNVINVVWADSKLHVFRLNVGPTGAFQTDGRIANVRRVSYDVVVYDCRAMMALPLGKAPAIAVINLAAAPT